MCQHAIYIALIDVHTDFWKRELSELTAARLIVQSVLTWCCDETLLGTVEIDAMEQKESQVTGSEDVKKDTMDDKVSSQVKYLKNVRKNLKRRFTIVKRNVSQRVFEFVGLSPSDDLHLADVTRLDVPLAHSFLEKGEKLYKEITLCQERLCDLAESQDDDAMQDEIDTWEEKWQGECNFLSILRYLISERDKVDKHIIGGRGGGTNAFGSYVDSDTNEHHQSASSEDEQHPSDEMKLQLPRHHHDWGMRKFESRERKSDASPPALNVTSDIADVVKSAAAEAAAAAVQAACTHASVKHDARDSSINSVVRLPRLELQPFEGDPLKWPEFWQVFEATIHERNDLAEVMKFSYLKGNLRSEAALAIEGIPLTAANYSVAVSILKNKFGQHQIIVASLYSRLIQLPSAANTFSSIKETVEIMEKLLRQLAAQGENLDSQPVLTQQLVSKFPLPLVTKLQEQRTDVLSPWTMKELRHCLAQYVTVQSTIRSLSEMTPFASSVSADKSYAKSATEVENLGTVHLLGGKVSNLPRLTPTCIFCQQQHYNDECTVYDSIAARKQRLLELRRCFICLQLNHIAATCPRRTQDKLCTHCRQRGHNRALCPAATKNTRANSSTGDALTKRSSALMASVEIPQSATREHVQVVAASGAHGHTSVPGNSVLLQTASCDVLDAAGQPHPARILLDSGSQRSFITNSLARRLGLKPELKETISLSTLTATHSKTIHTDLVTVKIQLRDGSSANLHVNSIPTITNELARPAIPERDLEYIRVMDATSLADTIPTSPETIHVDILVGSDYFWQFVECSHVTLPSGLQLVQSKFGYLLAGSRTVNNFEQQGVVTMMVGAASHSEIDYTTTHPSARDTISQISHLWNLEGIA